MGRVIVYDGERVSAEVAVNGRRAVGVRLWRTGTDDALCTDELAVVSADARAKLLANLPHDVRDDAARVLEAVALEVMRAAESTPSETTRRTVTLTDPEPAGEPVDGAALADELAVWFGRYVWLPDNAAITAALWTVATWCRDVLDYAPLLALLSPTKRCGKSRFLELLSHVVRRGHKTSAVGVTVPVLFRLNEAQQPTLCIDEAERLGGSDADRELIGLLNAGYEPGAVVHRLQESKDGYELVSYDAYGFRAVAAIGTLWDTLLDRALVLRLARKPRGKLERLNRKRVAAEGAELARKLARWAKDNAAAVGDAQLDTPQPAYLNDREVDNWGALFAVTRVMGPVALAAADVAAKTLAGAHRDEGDRGELLLADVRRVFDAHGFPEVLKSGDVVEALNKLDGAPWADERKGKGLSTHGLARLLGRFDVRASQARDKNGTITRGYWWAELEPVVTQWLGDT